MKASKKILFFSFLLTLLGFCLQTYAVETINIVGLFGNKIVIKVDEKQHILKSGATSPEGVKVIEINSESEYVVLEINGEQAEYPFGKSSVGTAYTKRNAEPVNIYKDQHGMYRTVGTINDFPVKFLVDTGASSVAISSNVANRLGVDYLSGKKIQASTAASVVPAYLVKLRSVSVGSIKLYNVEGVVLENGHEEILLGMSFLGRMKVEHEGNIMRLTPAY